MAKKRGQDNHSEYWGLYLALGILMIIFGILLLIFPFVGTFAIEILLGVTLLILGIMGFVMGIVSIHEKGSVFIFINGLIALIVGFLLLFYPWSGVIALTLLIGIFMIIQGIFEMARSSSFPKSWKTVVLIDGIFCLVLGILVLIGWPSDATWVIGLLLGLSLLFMGIVSICFGNAVRKVLN